jgi:drug/metabolite transporter (DMT)-like permease
MPRLRAATAATVQLSVPVIAAAGGLALLGEAMSLRLAVSAAAVLGGIALVIAGKQR